MNLSSLVLVLGVGGGTEEVLRECISHLVYYGLGSKIRIYEIAPAVLCIVSPCGGPSDNITIAADFVVWVFVFVFPFSTPLHNIISTIL